MFPPRKMDPYVLVLPGRGSERYPQLTYSRFIRCSDQSPNREDSYDEPLQKVSESALLAFHSPPLDSEPDTSAPSGSFQKKKGPAHLPTSLTSKQQELLF